MLAGWQLWTLGGMMAAGGLILGGAIVLLPYRKDTKPSTSHRLARYLFDLVLVSAIEIWFIVVIIFGIGLFAWGRPQTLNRQAFAVQEGIPYLLLGAWLSVAAVGLLRLRRWAWMLALAGSPVSLVYGIYRYSLSPVSIHWIPPSPTSPPWVSSDPGGLVAAVVGSVVLLHMLSLYLFFQPQATSFQTSA